MSRPLQALAALVPRTLAHAGHSSQLARISTSATASSSSDFYGAVPTFTQHRVVVTGLGLVTPLGVGVSRSWGRLIRGETGVRKLEACDLPEVQQSTLASLPCQVAGMVPRDQWAEASKGMKEDSSRHSRFIQLAVCAADEALKDAKWLPSTVKEKQYTGVALGSGMSATSEIAEAGRLILDGRLRRVTPFFVPRILPNMAAGAVSIRYGLQGPNHTVSTACASGVHALGDAFRMIQRGDARVMVAGASEACVDVVAIGGFSRLKALSTNCNDEPALSSRPFDAKRDGFVMGEGAGVVVMEDLQHALDRGAHIYAEVRGYGLSGDGFHVTQPHSEGLGGQICMRRALDVAGLKKEDIVYINAHATSTPVGDEIEQKAINQVFGDVENGIAANVAVSSTKGATGHLLGAAGAVESVFTILALHHSIAPPTVNLESPDPKILQNIVGPVAQPLRSGPKGAMCNSFGFGGTNACLVLTTPPSVM